MQPLTTESATVAADLYPGGTGALSLRVRNPNPFATTLRAVSPNGAITSDSAACNDGGHGVTFAGVSGLSLVVPASSSAQFDLADAVAMAEDSADACQGATFTIPVSLNGGSGGGGPADGTACDDGDPDTNNDVHQGGQCVGTPTIQHYQYMADNDGDGHGGTPTNFSGTSPPPSNQYGDNDSNASIHPAAQEVPNGIDDDCDGLTDDQDPNMVGGTTWYADQDSDGFGDPDTTTVSAAAPVGFVADGTDCNDSHAAIHPGAPETQNGIDDDCDGIVDE